MEQKELMKNKRGNIYNNKARQSYMSQPNVKEFNKKVREHSTRIGGPYAFTNVNTLRNELNDYFDLCDKTDTVPTITGIALWLGVHRDTIYSHAHDPNSPYSDILKNVINFCHMTMENGTIDGKVNPVTYIFLAKNYFGLEDSKNITVAASNNQSTANAQETAEALQKQLQEEHITEATISEK
jgi:hypothetical protein